MARYEAWCRLAETLEKKGSTFKVQGSMSQDIDRSPDRRSPSSDRRMTIDERIAEAHERHPALFERLEAILEQTRWLQDCTAKDLLEWVAETVPDRYPGLFDEMPDRDGQLAFLDTMLTLFRMSKIREQVRLSREDPHSPSKYIIQRDQSYDPDGWKNLMATPLLTGKEPKYPSQSLPGFVDNENSILKRPDIAIKLNEFTAGGEVLILGAMIEEFHELYELCPDASMFHLVNYSPREARNVADYAWNRFPELRARVKVYNIDATDIGEQIDAGSIRFVRVSGVLSDEYSDEEHNDAILEAVLTAASSGGLVVVRLSPGKGHDWYAAGRAAVLRAIEGRATVLANEAVNVIFKMNDGAERITHSVKRESPSGDISSKFIVHSSQETEDGHQVSRRKPYTENRSPWTLRQSPSGTATKRIVTIDPRAQELLPEKHGEELNDFLAHSKQFKDVWRILIERDKEERDGLIFTMYRSDGSRISFSLPISSEDSLSGIIERTRDLYRRNRSEFHSGRRGIVYWLSRVTSWVFNASFVLTLATPVIFHFEESIKAYIFEPWCTISGLPVLERLLTLWSVTLSLPILFMGGGLIAVSIFAILPEVCGDMIGKMLNHLGWMDSGYFQLKPEERANYVLHELKEKAKKRGDDELLDALNCIGGFQEVRWTPYFRGLDVPTRRIRISANLTNSKKALAYVIIRRAKMLLAHDLTRYPRSELYYSKLYINTGDFLFRHWHYTPVFHIYSLFITVAETLAIRIPRFINFVFIGLRERLLGPPESSVLNSVERSLRKDGFVVVRQIARDYVLFEEQSEALIERARNTFADLTRIDFPEGSAYYCAERFSPEEARSLQKFVSNASMSNEDAQGLPVKGFKRSFLVAGLAAAVLSAYLLRTGISRIQNTVNALKLAHIDDLSPGQIKETLNYAKDNLPEDYVFYYTIAWYVYGDNRQSEMCGTFLREWLGDAMDARCAELLSEDSDFNSATKRMAAARWIGERNLSRYLPRLIAHQKKLEAGEPFKSYELFLETARDVEFDPSMAEMVIRRKKLRELRIVNEAIRKLRSADAEKEKKAIKPTLDSQGHTKFFKEKRHPAALAGPYDQRSRIRKDLRRTQHRASPSGEGDSPSFDSSTGSEQDSAQDRESVVGSRKSTKSRAHSAEGIVHSENRERRPTNDARRNTTGQPANHKPPTADDTLKDLKAMMHRCDMYEALNADVVDKLEKVLVVASSDLMGSIDEKELGLRLALANGYKQMGYRIRSALRDKEIVWVDENEDIASRIAEATGTEKRKIIFIDSGDLAPRIRTMSGMKPGEDYCILETKMQKHDPLTIQFLNLDAFVLMGIGVLDGEYDLIRFTYRLLTGEDIDDEILTRIAEKTDSSWYIISVTPRAIMFDGDDQRNCNLLRKIFAVAA
ncbi:MAG: hypothetical protein ABIJ27_03840 [Candidatus Omnitrophota bacterium]